MSIPSPTYTMPNSSTVPSLVFAALLPVLTCSATFADDLQKSLESNSIPSAACFKPEYIANHPWYNVSKPIPERVKLLVDQMTPKEKTEVIGWNASAIPRLGIPAYDYGNECLHGLMRPDCNTSFPHGIGMAAMFDPGLIHEMTTAISDEARAHWNQNGGKVQKMCGVLVLWSPVVNMARDPRWGRTQETQGEDPFLSSRDGVAFVKGLQGDDSKYIKVVSTPKHFAGNNEESGRFSKDITCDERYLMEYELVPFEACVREAHAQSIMAAYTSINGVPSCENSWLLTEILRKRWGFDGFVTSDCGAISHIVDSFYKFKTPEEGIAAALKAGLDFEGGGYSRYPDMVNQQLPKAIELGLVPQEALDRAVTNVLTVRMRLGMFDPAEQVPYHTIPASMICSPEHQQLARKMADESIVLLKNDSLGGQAVLPLDLTRVKTVALVGPLAAKLNLGDYSGAPLPAQSYTPLRGLKERCEKAGISLKVYPWQAANQDVIPSTSLDTVDPNGKSEVHGLTGRYFGRGTINFEKDKPVVTRVDPELNFDWAHIQPDPLASGKEFSVEWTGTLNCLSPGNYLFSVTCDGGFKLEVNGSGIDKLNDKMRYRKTQTWSVSVDKAGKVPIRVVYQHRGGDTGFQLRWRTPDHPDSSLTEIKNADVVVAVMGLTTSDETEGKDRSTIRLSPLQEDFIARVAAANPKTVLVTESGSPLALGRQAQQVPAMIQMFYGGQEQGRALADVLFGDYNPAGRLPVTFYADDSQLRPMEEYDITKGRTYMYLADKPTFAFGHGLSYTSFKYEGLQLSSDSVPVGKTFDVSVHVTNSGSRDGDEVVQAYVHAQKSSVPMPIRQLWGFQRVHLAKGETKVVTLTLDSSRFGHWDKGQQNFVVEPGAFEVQVGSASDDIRLTQTVQLTP